MAVVMEPLAHDRRRPPLGNTCLEFAVATSSKRCLSYAGFLPHRLLAVQEKAARVPWKLYAKDLPDSCPDTDSERYCEPAVSPGHLGTPCAHGGVTECDRRGRAGGWRGEVPAKHPRWWEMDDEPVSEGCVWPSMDDELAKESRTLCVGACEVAVRDVVTAQLRSQG